MLKVRHTLLIAIAYTLSACAGSDVPESTNQQIVMAETFDDFFKSSFASSLHHLELADIVYNEGVADSKALIVYYQGNERGSRRIVENFLLDSPLEHASVQFDVKFCEGFDFSRGGKLHGLVPLKPVAGGNKTRPQSWSARAMWGKHGSLKSYVYHQQMKGKYGDTVSAADFRFEPGRYYTVRYEVKLNKPVSEANGEFSIFINGKQVVHHTGIQYRATEGEDTAIRQLTFNTFHGGNDPSWAPRTQGGDFKRDCAYFDNFVVEGNH